MSMSFGGSENTGSINSFNPLFNNNIIYFGASGDTSSSSRVKVPQLYPAVCNNVIAVGGTSLNVANQTVIETGWSQSGGGISTIVAQPSYQIGKNNNSSPNKRCIPDISSLSDPYTGIYIFLNGILQGPYGGTSLASPICASIIALLVQSSATFRNQKVSLSASKLMQFIYSNVGLNAIDIVNMADTVRSTNIYTPVSGYDLVTGCGSFNYSKLVACINSINTFIVKI